jgi:hypothetical protein
MQAPPPTRRGIMNINTQATIIASGRIQQKFQYHIRTSISSVQDETGVKKDTGRLGVSFPPCLMEGT